MFSAVTSDANMDNQWQTGYPQITTKYPGYVSKQHVHHRPAAFLLFTCGAVSSDGSVSFPSPDLNEKHTSFSFLQLTL